MLYLRPAEISLLDVFAVPERGRNLDTLTRRILLVISDAIIVIMALLAGFLIHYEGRIPAMYFDTYYTLFLLFVAVKITVFFLSGMYNRLWRYASIIDLVNITRAVIISAIILSSLMFFQRARFPRTVLALDFFITLFFVGFIRLAIRIRHEYFLRAKPHYDSRQVVVIGAGDAGEMIIREMIKHPELGYFPVGILDDDRNKSGLKIHGIQVLGNTRKLDEIILDFDIREVVIAIPSASGKVIRRIIRHCKTQGVTFTTVPGVFELIDGSVHVSQLRKIRIEDLLGRQPVDMDLEKVRFILSDKTVLVTGAGGSIGSQLCRDIARFNPRLIIMFGRGENSIHTLAGEFDRHFPTIDKVLVIGSITNENKVNEVFRRHRPEVVFHAAAHKHVPLMELHPDEAIRNNIMGTRNVVNASEFHKVETFVLVSTDKAVHPSSVMGAAKRMAELVVQSRAHCSSTRFVVVRFGNVLGSRGSVIPIFMQQIRDGGPVTITHPDVERYFMTIPEAAKLVIEAQSMANGGEIYILDMGEPIRIIDLAKDMIRLTGLEPGEDIKIKFTGLRPGEKLREELLSQDENAQATSHKKIFTAQRTTISRDVIDSIIDQLIVDCNNSDNLDLRRQLMDSLRVAEQKTKKGRERIVKLFSDDQPPHSTNRKQHNP